MPGKARRMTVVGFHASHEQVHPTALLEAVQLAEDAGFTARHVVRPLLAVERAAGPLGLRLVLAGRGAAGHRPAVRRGERAGPALPPGDHRAGVGDAGRDVPAAGSGSRSAPARRPTSTSPAAAGRARSCATPRLRECVDVIRALLAGEEVSHDGLVTVDRARLWTLPEMPPPLIGAAVSVETAAMGGRLGRRARHGRPAARAPARDGRRLPRRRRPGTARTCRCTCPTPPTRTTASRIAHDQWRTNVFAPPVCWDIDTAQTSTRWPSTCRRSHARHGARLGRPGRHAAWLPSSPSSASTRSTCTTSGRSSGSSSTPSASKVLPQLDVTAKVAS